jgi:hypothetical protein
MSILTFMQSKDQSRQVACEHGGRSSEMQVPAVRLARPHRLGSCVSTGWAVRPSRRIPDVTRQLTDGRTVRRIGVHLDPYLWKAIAMFIALSACGPAMMAPSRCRG